MAFAKAAIKKLWYPFLHRSIFSLTSYNQLWFSASMLMGPRNLLLIGMSARVCPGASINRVLNIDGPSLSKELGFYPFLGAMVLGYAQAFILTHYHYLKCNNFYP
ncbi:MAG TPA: hypothetical protein ENG03_03625 [Thioploca sp.]|nr:hypothetical protein [Thioploca sp.]